MSRQDIVFKITILELAIIMHVLLGKYYHSLKMINEDKKYLKPTSFWVPGVCRIFALWRGHGSCDGIYTMPLCVWMTRTWLAFTVFLARNYYLRCSWWDSVMATSNTKLYDKMTFKWPLPSKGPSPMSWKMYAGRSSTYRWQTTTTLAQMFLKSYSMVYKSYKLISN